MYNLLNVEKALIIINAFLVKLNFKDLKIENMKRDINLEIKSTHLIIGNKTNFKIQICKPKKRETDIVKIQYYGLFLEPFIKNNKTRHVLIIK